MTKGWFGDRQQHGLASRGIRVGKSSYEPFPINIGHHDFRVAVIDENGRTYYEFFKNEQDAYERWIEYCSEGQETWYGKYDNEEDDYETVQMYDPDLSEDDNYWDNVHEAQKIVNEFNVDLKDDYIKKLIQLYADDNINETTLRDRIYEYESEFKTSGIKSYIEPPSEEIIYRGQLIERQFPSGFYRYYSDKEKGFIRADEINTIKARIDRGV